MAASSESYAPRLSKWDLSIILGVGTPVALGLAYYYYKKKKSKVSSECKDGFQHKSSKKESTESSKTDINSVPENPYLKARSFKDEGNKYFKEGKFNKAIECYTSAIEICPTDKSEDLATFYQNRAAAYEALKNYDAVVKDTTASLEYNKSYVKAIHRRAKALEATGEWHKALEDITAVCMFDGFKSVSYLTMTDRLLKELSQREAKKDFAKKEPILPSKHSIRHYLMSFVEDPIMKKVEDYKNEKKDPCELSGLRLAIHHLAEENYEEVIPSCNAEIENNGPDLAEAYLLRGTFQKLQGQDEAAMADIKTCLEMENVDLKVKVNCLIKIAILSVQMEKTDALESFQKAFEYDPNNADIYLHRGQVHLIQERFEDCKSDMDRCCALKPSFAKAHAQRLFIEYQSGVHFQDEQRKLAAVNAYDALEGKFPDCAEIYFVHAQALAEIGQFENAQSFFRKAGELDPRDPNVYVHLGILTLQWKEDIDQAVAFITKAVEMDEKCQFALETLASLEIQKNNLPGAVELLQRAVAAAHTESALAHIYSLLLAAKAQIAAVQRFGPVVA